MDEPTTGEYRWRAHPVLASVVTAAAFALPVACSIGAGAVLSRLLARPPTIEMAVFRWVAIVGAASIVFIGCERVGRRVLPLATLLTLPVAFPGPVPRRLTLAKRSWTLHTSTSRSDEIERPTISRDSTVAAEQILVLVGALAVHDRNTYRRACRMRVLCDRTTDRLRMPEDERDRLCWAAFVLVLGVRMGGAERHNASVGASTIADHNDDVDGAGYPVALAGKEISLGRRIVAVTEFYDDMTRLRRYHGPTSRKAARLQLAAYAGERFDPVVVRAFLALPARRGVTHLTTIGTFVFGSSGARFSRLAGTSGRVAISAVVIVAALVGLAVGRGTVVPAPPTHFSAAPKGVLRPSSPRVKDPTFASGGGGSAAPSRDGWGTGTTTTTTTDRTDLGEPLPPGAGGSAAGVEPPTLRETSSSGSATPGSSGSPSSTPVTTVGRSPTSSTTTTSTTTSDPPPPPIDPPSGLMATSDCRVAVLLPEVLLSWTPSSTADVTSYVILRGLSLTSLTYVGTVEGHSGSFYRDVSVSGMDTTYWYEVEAVTRGPSARSAPVSVTTPSLCISLGTPA